MVIAELAWNALNAISIRQQMYILQWKLDLQLYPYIEDEEVNVSLLAWIALSQSDLLHSPPMTLRHTKVIMFECPRCSNSNLRSRRWLREKYERCISVWLTSMIRWSIPQRDGVVPLFITDRNACYPSDPNPTVHEDS